MSKRYLFISVLALFLLSAGSVAAKAAKGADYRIQADEVVTSNVYRAAESIVVAGVVQGDLIVAAQNIEITGTVEGDVIAAGQTIQISGDVKGNVRVAGQNIILIGEIGKNVTAFGQNITVDGIVGWSVVAYGQSIRLGGSIVKDVDTGGENVAIEGNIGGDLTVRSDESDLVSSEPSRTRIFETATIAGDLRYSGKKPVIDQESSIAGTVRFIGSPIENVSKVGIGIAVLSFAVFVKIVSIAGMMIVALLLIRFFKKDVWQVVNEAIAHPTMNFLWGIVVLVVTPVILVVLAITLIGLPLALIGGVIYALLIYLAKIFVGVIAGIKIVQGMSKVKLDGGRLYGAALLGIFVMNLIFLIPVLGAIVWFFCFLEVAGALFMVIKNRLAQRVG